MGLVYHTQVFNDHAGRPATRVRLSETGDPIPTDSHATPVFTFQVYLTVPLDLSQPAAHRLSAAGDECSAGSTILHDLLAYLGNTLSDSQRAPPLWDIYNLPINDLDCVEHQRREIAFRKAKREDHGVVPIPKVVMPPLEPRYTLTKTGLIIVVDTAAFAKENQDPDRPVRNWKDLECPLWVWFERRSPSKLSWEPRLRLNCDLRDLDDILGPGTIPRILPELLNCNFSRVRAWEKVNCEFSMLYFASCIPDRLASIDEGMDVAWDEDEGTFDLGTFGPLSPPCDQTAAMSLHDLSIAEQSATRIVVSNVPMNAEADLRYVVYAPFLHNPKFAHMLKEAAITFTHELVSRMSDGKTVHLEFCKPSSPSLSSVLVDHKREELPSDYVGAVRDLSNGSGDDVSRSLRIHPISREETIEENYPTACESDPYCTSIVVLETADFARVPGRKLFLLTDGGRPRDGREEWDTSEIEAYQELVILRSAGMDEVARRLQMKFGGVIWPYDRGQHIHDDPEQHAKGDHGFLNTDVPEVTWVDTGKEWAETEMSCGTEGKQGEWCHCGEACSSCVSETKARCSINQKVWLT